MPMVNTVLGPISADTLGVTLMHEHIVCGTPGWHPDNRLSAFEREAVVKASLATMEQLKACGVRTLVDVTTNDTGRDAGLLKEVSQKSGTNIICATGLYRETEGALAYFRLGSHTGDATSEIYELFLQEITEGIGPTGVKAGVIKVGTSHGRISRYEEMVLRAAARAQKGTDVPIITHTERGTMGPEQADLLISEGVAPERIMVGHCGGSADLKYHVAILEKGVYVAFDRLGLDVAQPDLLRKACIIGLIGIGYANRIMLAHDTVVQFLGRPGWQDVSLVLPNWVPTHVFKHIIPTLKEAGVTGDKIDMMMVENPRRLFGGE